MKRPPKDIVDHLRYDAKTGYLWWRVPGLARQLHRPAGTYARAYPTVRFRREIYYVHRLAWLFQTGKYPLVEVDHKDGNPTNNAWKNLRLATRAQQRQNSRFSKTNTSGYKGVYWSEEKQKYCARIKNQSRSMHLGYFSTAAKAGAAYRRAARRIFGEYARV